MDHVYAHPAASSQEQLLAECQVRRLRRSGPGGQHRNKVETAVELRHRPTGVTAQASERRSQAENRSVALRRLRVKLALKVRGPAGMQQAPSPLWQSRCHQGRIAVSPTHDDFPTILAEALDAITHAEADVRQAAAGLGCTTSQLVGLLNKEPGAMAMVNQWRQARGLPPLQ
ncbi:MAG: peptide chain release factor 1 [Planctomycetes bacterium RBG_13_63_9]|nr:MAG: peptide chain release factor 1 [Planctomycetes bacterium RBG_13_63_9]